MRIEKLTYAGHSAVLLDTPEITVAIDPWLEGNPACPKELKKPARLDLILLTHGHSDHASDAVALARTYGASIAATWELASLLIAEGVPEQQVLPMNTGGTLVFRELNISLTPAFHSSSYDTSSGPVYAGQACGVVVNDGHSCIYHAGDTSLFSDIELLRRIHQPTIALLPIGDRFTMGPKEAAEAARLIGSATLIPIHYATFGMLTGTAEEFKHYCAALPGQRVHDLQPGESLRIE